MLKIIVGTEGNDRSVTFQVSTMSRERINLCPLFVLDLNQSDQWNTLLSVGGEIFQLTEVIMAKAMVFIAINLT